MWGEGGGMEGGCGWGMVVAGVCGGAGVGGLRCAGRRWRVVWTLLRPALFFARSCDCIVVFTEPARGEFYSRGLHGGFAGLLGDPVGVWGCWGMQWVRGGVGGSRGCEGVLGDPVGVWGCWGILGRCGGVGGSRGGEGVWGESRRSPRSRCTL